MISLITGFWKSWNARPFYKILIIGIENSGKTTLLNQLKKINDQKHLPFEKITPTVGLNIAKFQTDKFNTLFWDLGGQPVFRTIWKKYYAECHGIIYMIDGSDEDKLMDSIVTLSEFLKNPDLNGVPVLIFLNKADKKDCRSIEYIHEKLKLDKVIDREINILLISALKGDNVSVSMNWIYSAIQDFCNKSMQLKV